MKQSINFLKVFVVTLCIFSTSFTASPLFAQKVVGTITRPNFNPGTLAVYEAGNKLFVGDWETGNLLIYDGTSLDLLAELPIDGGCGGSCMVVHEASGKLYFGTFPSGRHIAVVNAVTNELIGYIEIDGGCEKIDQELGRVYTISRLAPHVLYVINVETDEVNSVSLSNAGLTSGLAVNPVTHEVFIGYLQGESLDIVDGITMERATVSGINGRHVIINWLENKVYGEKGTYNGFWVYDRDIDSMKVCITYNDANPEIFNPTSNRVHTCTEVNGTTTIIEGTDDSWINMPIYSGLIELGVRYSTNHVYYVGSHHIVVLDGSTLEWLIDIPITKLENSKGQDIAINQSTGRVFVRYSSYSEDGIVLVIQDSLVTVEPDIDVYPDTLCFGIPVNQNSSINTDSNTAYHNYKLQELSDNKPHQLTRGKKILSNSLRLSQETPHSSNLQWLPGKGNIDTLLFDDGVPEYIYSWGNGARMASRMSPVDSCKILAIQIYCESAQSYKVGVYDWSGSHPGNQILETAIVSSPGQGWNTTDISSYNINVNGDFIASFNMIDTVAYLGFDTFNNGRAWDYDGVFWSAWNETYFIRAIVEYEDGVVDTVGTMSIKNLGNTDLVVNDITTSQEWITSIEPHSLTVVPYGSEDVSVTVSTAGLSNGTYYGSLNIFSNDPDENPYIEPVKFVVNVVGIEEDTRHLDIPNTYYLSQNYPNPFNPETIIMYELPKSCHVVIKIYNTLGHEIKTLIDKKINAGYHQIIWDGKDNLDQLVSSGIYLYQIKTEKFIAIKKMVFLQ